MKDLKNIRSFDELLDAKYGEISTHTRTEFEYKAKAFMIGELLKEARKETKMRQDQLALKTGTKKSYISRLGNGGIDIQLYTLFRIFEEGLGKKINLTLG